MSAPSWHARWRARHALARGAEALAANRPERALARFEQAVGFAAGDLELSLRGHDRAALVLEAQGRGDLAIPHLKALTFLDPEHVGHWRRLVPLLEAAGDWRGEVEAWERLLALSAEEFTAHKRLSRLYLAQGDFPKAVIHLLALAERASTDPDRWRRLARALSETGAAREEILGWRRLLAAAPDDLEAHRRLAELLPPGPEAVPHLRVLAEAQPGEAEPWRRLAGALRVSDARQGEIDAWRRVLALGDDPEAHQRLAELLPPGPEAVPHLRAVAEASPRQARSWKRLAGAFKVARDSASEAGAWRRVLSLRDDLEAHLRLVELLPPGPEAVPHLRVAVQASPEQAKGWKRLARSLTVAGDSAGEVEAWGRVLSLGDDPEAHQRLVELLPPGPEAIPHLRAAVEASPEQAKAWKRLARSLAVAGDSAGAVEAWRRVLSLEDDPEAHQRLVELLPPGPEAIPHLRALAEASPSQAKSWARLARSLAVAGDSAGAVEAWRRVLSLEDDPEAHLRLVELLPGPEAIPHLRVLAEASPEQSKAWKRLARALTVAGDSAGEVEAWRRTLSLGDDAEAHRRLTELLPPGPEAVPHLRALAEASPGQAKSWARLARSLAVAGDASGEVEAWRRVLSAGGEELEARRRLAEVLPPGEEALVNLRALAEAAGTDASAWRRLAHAARSALAAEDEVLAWRRLLDLREDAGVREQLAFTLHRLDRKAEAAEHLRMLAQASPASDKPWRRLGRCLEEISNRRDAIAAWRQVLMITGHDVEAHERLSQLLLAEGLRREALPHLRATLAGKAEDAPGWKDLARTLRMATGAEPVVGTLVAADIPAPDDWRAWLGLLAGSEDAASNPPEPRSENAQPTVDDLLNALVALQSPDGDDRTTERAASAAQALALSKYAEAQLHLLHHHFGPAVQTLQDSALLNPWNAETWSTLAETAQSARQHGLADSASRAAVRLAPELAAPHEIRAEILAQQGRSGLAMAHMVRAIEQGPKDLANATDVIQRCFPSLGEGESVEILARTLAARGHRAEAVTAFTKCLARMKTRKHQALRRALLDLSGASAGKGRRGRVGKAQPPLVLISQIQRSGGTLLAQLFDGHSQLLVHPDELKIGFPAKWDWPKLDMASTPREWLETLFEVYIAVFMVDGYAKADGNVHAGAASHPFTFDLDRLCEVFLARTAKASRQREVIDAYLAGYFAGWKEGAPSGDEQWTVAFCPRLAMFDGSVSGFFDDYPDGRLISCIRDPVSWYVSSTRHAEEYQSLDDALQLWVRSTEAVMAQARIRPEQVHLLTYEQLVADPEAAMRRLCLTLGISYEPILAAPTYAKSPILPNSSFAIREHGVHTRSLDQRRLLTPEQLAHIERVAGGLYRDACALTGGRRLPRRKSAKRSTMAG